MTLLWTAREPKPIHGGQSSGFRMGQIVGVCVGQLVGRYTVCG